MYFFLWWRLNKHLVPLTCCVAVTHTHTHIRPIRTLDSLPSSSSSPSTEYFLSYCSKLMYLTTEELESSTHTAQTSEEVREKSTRVSWKHTHTQSYYVGAVSSCSTFSPASVPTLMNVSVPICTYVYLSLFLCICHFMCVIEGDRSGFPLLFHPTPTGKALSHPSPGKMSPTPILNDSHSSTAPHFFFSYSL